MILKTSSVNFETRAETAAGTDPGRPGPRRARSERPGCQKPARTCRPRQVRPRRHQHQHQAPLRQAQAQALAHRASRLATVPRAAKLAGGFVNRLAFEVAEHRRGAQLLGQPAHFFVHEGAHLLLLNANLLAGRSGHFFHGIERLRFSALAHRPGRQGHAIGDPVKPAGECLMLADAPALAGEDQEGGLQGILGVVEIMQHAPADTEHQPLMPPDQQLERSLVAGRGKAFQRRTVTDAGFALGRRAPDPAENPGELEVGHRSIPYLSPYRYRGDERDLYP